MSYEQDREDQSAKQGLYDPELWADRESTADECDLAIEVGAEQERILEASRAVRRGDSMLFSALRKAGAL